MTTLNPKEQFQKSIGAEKCVEFQRISEVSVVHLALSMAMAQFANEGASAEQLLGAKRFAHTFLNLAEIEKPVVATPRPKLKTYGPEQE